MDTPGPKGKHKSEAVIVDGSRPEPGDWCAPVLAGWEEFWSSPASEIVSGKDHVALRRLFELRDEYEMFRSLGMTEPLVEGSTGQDVLNPALKRCEFLLGEIRQLEDRFGLSPGKGVGLGLKVARVRRLSDDFGRV